MKEFREKAYLLLRKSEAFFKTDMVYLARGGSWLGIGQVASAGIAFISSLFFANIVSKDLYGSYKFIIASTSILATFSLSGMGSVVTQGVARGFEGILDKAVRTTLRFGTIIFISALGLSIYYFLNKNYVLGFSMLIAGISLPFNQAYSLAGSYLLGKKEFKKVTVTNTASQFLTTTAVIISAITTKNLLITVATYFVFNTLTTIWVYIYTKRKFNINDTQDHTLIPYGKHLSLMSTFGTIANQFDKLLVFHYLGAIQLAIYAFSQALPDQIRAVYKNIFTIAIPKYALYSQAEMRVSMMRKFKQLSLLTIGIILLYIVCAPFIFTHFFPKYMDSLFYSQIYILGLITIPGIGLFANYFQLKKATRIQYKLNIIGNTSTLIITFFLIYTYGLLGAVMANGLSWLVMLLTHWYYFINDKEVSEINLIQV